MTFIAQVKKILHILLVNPQKSFKYTHQQQYDFDHKCHFANDFLLLHCKFQYSNFSRFYFPTDFTYEMRAITYTSLNYTEEKVKRTGAASSLETLKYWVGVQQGQFYLMGRRCLFSLGWPPF